MCIRNIETRIVFTAVGDTPRSLSLSFCLPTSPSLFLLLSLSFSTYCSPLFVLLPLAISISLAAHAFKRIYIFIYAWNEHDEIRLQFCYESTVRMCVAVCGSVCVCV